VLTHLEPWHSVVGKAWHWRRNKALAAERCACLAGCRRLDELRVYQAIRPFATSLVGAEAFGKLDAYCRQVFRDRGYWYGFWCDVLAGKQVECTGDHWLTCRMRVAPLATSLVLVRLLPRPHPL
jgi:hypothetical protein